MKGLIPASTEPMTLDINLDGRQVDLRIIERKFREVLQGRHWVRSTGAVESICYRWTPWEDVPHIKTNQQGKQHG